MNDENKNIDVTKIITAFKQVFGYFGFSILWLKDKIVSIWNWFTGYPDRLFAFFITLFISIFVIGIPLAITWDNMEEIDHYDYERIEKMLIKYPKIKPLVKECFENDGYISEWEEGTIRDVYKVEEDRLEEIELQKQRNIIQKRLTGG